MNIKGLISAAVVTLAGVGVAAPAQASSTCFEFLGGTACNRYVATTYSGQVYEVGFAGGDLKEKLTVTCDGTHFVEYRSFGNMSQAQADFVAREFCALPNN